MALAGPTGMTPITPELADKIHGMVLSEECLIDDALKTEFMVGDRYTFMPMLNPWQTIPAPHD